MLITENRSLAGFHQVFPAAEASKMDDNRSDVSAFPSDSFSSMSYLLLNTTDNPTLDNLTDSCLLNNTTRYAREPSGPYPSGYSWVHIILACIVVSLIMLVIVIGNILVIAAIATDRQLTGVQNWFIASLAVSDLCVGLLIMPLSLANEMMGFWYFGEVMCDLWLSTDVLLCTASILNLCLISIDRYWSITRAVAYVKQRTRRRAILMISLVWILSMILCFPPLAGWKRPQPENEGFPLCLLSEEPGYIVYSTMGSFYIPLAVMVLVYFKIYLAARARAWRNVKRPVTVAPGTNNSKSTSTSFSNPQQASQAAHCLPVPEESNIVFSHSNVSCSDDDDEMVTVMPETYDEPSVEVQTVTVGTSTSETDVRGNGPIELHRGGIQNHKVYINSADEKKNLLSEETDTDHEKGQPRVVISVVDKCSDDVCVNSARLSESANGGWRKEDADDDNVRPLLDTLRAPSVSEARLSDAKRVHLSIPPANIAKPTVSYEDGSARHKKHTKQKQQLKNNMFAPPSRASLALTKQISLKKRKKNHTSDADRSRRKIARAKERRATIVLGIIMATFIGCWLPFFSIYLITSLAKWKIPNPVFATIFWLGYCNSALNPIIYTIFNQDFRQAFKKILFVKRYTGV